MRGWPTAPGLGAMAWGLVLAAAGTPTRAETLVSAGVSGQYGPLSIAVGATGLTAHFDGGGRSWETANDAAGGCRFYLHGERRVAAYRVSAWVPGSSETVTGDASFLPEGEGMRFFLRLARTPAGCLTAYPFDAESGNYFPSRARTAWTAVRMVSTPMADLYSAPGATSRTGVRLMRFAPVLMFRQTSGWLEVARIGEDGRRLWVREGDVLDVSPGVFAGVSRSEMTRYKKLDVAPFDRVRRAVPPAAAAGPARHGALDARLRA